MAAISAMHDGDTDPEIVEAVEQLRLLRGVLRRREVVGSYAAKIEWQIANLERWLANARRLAAT